MPKIETKSDKKLIDNIKQYWTTWNNGSDELLNPFRSFDDFLLGYLICFYEGEPFRVATAVEDFNELIKEWEEEQY